MSESNLAGLLVTPEVVGPIPKGQAPPEIKMPKPFLSEAPQIVPRTPGTETTGPAPAPPVRQAIPVEQLIEMQKTGNLAQTTLPDSMIERN